MSKVLVRVFVSVLFLQIAHYLIISTDIFPFLLNSSGALGISIGNNYIHLSLSIIVILLVLYLFREKYNSVSILLILIGGISNIIDRLAWGGVVDYIQIWFLPMFNIPDLFISLGFLWYVIDTFIFDNNRLNEEKVDSKR
jgi:signal peptidase II